MHPISDFKNRMNNPVRYILLLCLFALTIEGKAQLESNPDNDKYMTGAPIFSHPVYYTGMIMYEGEMIPSFEFGDFYVFNKLRFKNVRQAKKYYKVANNIKKVYPIACEIQRVVNKTIAHMDSLSTKKEKDEYMKVAEKELIAAYKPKLKKLTFSQGKLLIKLVDRQCNQTGYELIRTYMGKFKAGFYNAFASLFGASLKKEYDAECDDRLTERAIMLIESGQL